MTPPVWPLTRDEVRICNAFALWFCVVSRPRVLAPLIRTPMP